MRHFLLKVLPAAALALQPALVLAQSMPGSEGAASVDATPAAIGDSAPLPAPKVSSRAIPDGAPPTVDALASVTHMADGTVTTTPASAALAALVGNETTFVPTAGATAGTAAAAAPTLTPIPDTKSYPFRTVGQVDVTYGTQTFHCTGVLVGPATVLTAAQCLWSGDGNPNWADKIVFYPGASDGQSPFGAIAVANATVMNGFFVGQTSATSDGSLPYQVGVVTLAEPIGNKIGWLGLQTDLNKSFSPNAVTYAQGKRAAALFTTTCAVDASTMYRSFAFPASCLAGPWGSPFYIEDAKKAKFVSGLNIYAYDGGSTGEARISPVTYQWILDNRK